MTTREEFDAIRCPKCGGQDFAIEHVETVLYRVKGFHDDGQDGGLLLSEEEIVSCDRGDYFCRSCDVRVPKLHQFDVADYV